MNGPRRRWSVPVPHHALSAVVAVLFLLGCGAAEDDDLADGDGHRWMSEQQRQAVAMGYAGI